MNELSVRQYLHNDGSGLTWGYDKREADKVIEELEKKLDIYKRGWMENDRVNANQYAEIRKAKRALWLARANRALEKIAWFRLWNMSISTMNTEDGARQEFDKWKKNLGKFLKKAEEYK